MASSEAAVGNAETDVSAAGDAVVPDLGSLLNLLVLNDFIDGSELCLVGSTCRDMRVRALQDDLWSYLCRNNLKENTQLVPWSIIEAKGHRWLYRKLLPPSVEQTIPLPPPIDRRVPLPPPTLTCGDFSFMINVQFRGKSILSKNLTGDDLAPLLQNGTVTLDLDNPVDMGSFLPLEIVDLDDPMLDFYDPCGHPEGLGDYPNSPARCFSATMHLANLSSNDMVCIYRSYDSVVGDICEVDATFNVHPEITTEVGGVEMEGAFGSEMPLRSSAKSLIKRIMESTRIKRIMESTDPSGTIPSVFFCLTVVPGQCSPAEQVADRSFIRCEKLDLETRRLFISLDKLEVSIRLLTHSFGIPFGSGERSGVSMLHLLEHVDWDA